MATKKLVALKPKLVSPQEIHNLKKKFGSLRTTVSTYTTKYGTLCTLYTFWQGQEKAGQLHDYGYGQVLKSFIDKTFYTTEKAWLDK